MVDDWTSEGSMVFEAAEAETRCFGDGYLTAEHLLLGLLQPGDGIVRELLSELGADARQLHERVEHYLRREGDEQFVASEPSWEAEPEPNEGFPEQDADSPILVLLTPRSEQIANAALAEAGRLGAEFAGPEHLLVSIARLGGSLAAWKLAQLGATAERLVEATERRAPLGWQASAAQRKHEEQVLLRAGNFAALVVIGLAIQIAFAVAAPGLLDLGPSIGRGGGRHAGPSAWVFLTSICLIPMISLRSREGWVWGQAILMVEATSSTAIFLLTVMRSNTGFGLPLVLVHGVRALFVMSMALALFHARIWFGIQERRHWHILLREGVWALLISACLQFPRLFALAQ